MNIDHVNTKFELPDTSIWEAIFQRQHELEVKYGPIERKNGYYYPPIEVVPNINDGQFQRWIKDMFWRATEEIAEAMEFEPTPAQLQDWKGQWQDPNIRHFFEELADSVHFLTAVSILAGVTWMDVNTQMEEIGATSNYEQAPGTVVSLKERCAEFIIALGLAANCLKNKPWKTTQMLTDATVFRTKLMFTWSRMLALWKHINAEPVDLYMLYCKKNEVNRFRQASKY